MYYINNKQLVIHNSLLLAEFLKRNIREMLKQHFASPKNNPD